MDRPINTTGGSYTALASDIWQIEADRRIDAFDDQDELPFARQSSTVNYGNVRKKKLRRFFLLRVCQSSCGSSLVDVIQRGEGVGLHYPIVSPRLL